ncbi:MAG: hypothetical protein WCW13_05580 [archaeon]|jgi:hypothetical protein
MRKSFSTFDIQKHLAARYGRQVGIRALNSARASLFGRSKNKESAQLTPVQALQVKDAVLSNASRLNISDSKKDQIIALLQERMRSDPYSQVSLETIAKKVSNPKHPISVRELKKLNRGIVAQARSEGVNIRKGYDPVRGKVIGKFREILRANINLTTPQILNQLGISYGELQRILVKYKTTLKKETKAARVRAIQSLDIQTGHTLNVREMAQRLGLKESYIIDNWTRGKAIGVRNKTQKISKNFLFLLGYFTSPEVGVFSFDRLVKITGSTKPVAFGAIKLLKKQGLIFEEDHDGSRLYSISSKGYKLLNGLGARAEQRAQRLVTMSLDEVENIFSLLQNAQKIGLEVGSELGVIQKIVEKKRFADFLKRHPQ